jgi:DtxR family Mn-dependent transcriptional regulator
MKLTQSSEDYLEAILLLSQEKKVVRVKDLAKLLGVTMPSVVTAMHSLKEKGLVSQERYGYLELTEEGERLAREVLKRHNLLFYFFHDVLGIDAELSERDACNVEHHLSKETLSALIAFLSVLETKEDLEDLKREIKEAREAERGNAPL